MLPMYSTSLSTPHLYVPYPSGRPGCVKCSYPESNPIHTGRESSVVTKPTPVLCADATRMRRTPRRAVRR